MKDGGKKLAIVCLALGVLFGASRARAQVKVWQSEDSPSRNVKVFGFIQPRLDVQSDSGGLFRVRRTRFGFEPSFDSWLKGVVELDFSGGHIVDAYAVIGSSAKFRLNVGRFRVPISRQNLISSRKWQMVDPAVFVGKRYSIDRQDGVMVGGRLFGDVLGYDVGVFNGNGVARDNMKGDSFPMVAARVEVTPLGPLPHFESDVRPVGARAKPLIGFGAGVVHDCLEADAKGQTYLSGDFSMYWAGASMVAEVYYRHESRLATEHVVSTPYLSGLVGACTVSGTDSSERQPMRDVFGYHLQVGSFMPGDYASRHLEIALMHEYFDPRRNVRDDREKPATGRVSSDYLVWGGSYWSVGVGVNWFLSGLREDDPRSGDAHNTKLQVGYVRRTVLDKSSEPSLQSTSQVPASQVTLQLTTGF